MGLSVLPYMEHILAERKKVVDFYNLNTDFSKVRKIKLREETKWNYSYYPIVFESEQKLLDVQKKLNDNNIFPRRYFYPSLNTINYLIGKKMPISESVASRILCLPLYVGLGLNDLNVISKILNS
jgi:dTDP-4-amino-4,6-dideoxygalactose transaminase